MNTKLNDLNLSIKNGIKPRQNSDHDLSNRYSRQSPNYYARIQDLNGDSQNIGY